jgi:hypothetical protein
MSCSQITTLKLGKKSTFKMLYYFRGLSYHGNSAQSLTNNKWWIINYVDLESGYLVSNLHLYHKILAMHLNHDGSLWISVLILSVRLIVVTCLLHWTLVCRICWAWCKTWSAEYRFSPEEENQNTVWCNWKPKCSLRSFGGIFGGILKWSHDILQEQEWFVTDASVFSLNIRRTSFYT